MSDNEEYQPESDVLPDEQQDIINRDVEAQELEQAIGPQPRAADFTDYDDYVKSLADHRVAKERYEWNKQQEIRERDRANRAAAYRLSPDNPNMDVGTVLSEAMREALEADRAAQVLAQQQAKLDIGPVPDDPLGGKRAELERISNEFSMEAIKCKEAGDVKGYHTWRQRQVQYENELAKLPPKPEVEFAENQIDEVDFRSINLLFDKNRASDKMWDSPRMQHDAAIVIVRHNERSRHGAIALPAEDSPFGNPLACTPQNMVQVKLPPEQLKEFQRIVYRSGGDDSPDAVIRRSWRALHKMGYSSLAQPAIEKKAAKKAEDPDTTENPDADVLEALL